MGFNLKSIKTVETFEIEIKDEDGNETGVFFTLAGPNHPVRKQAQLVASRKLVANANKTGKVELPDPAESEADKIKLLTQCTLGWRGYSDDKGEVAFSQEAARELYSDNELLWLVDQVDGALVEKANFTKRSAKG